jgi:hypothetical protein
MVGRVTLNVLKQAILDDLFVPRPGRDISNEPSKRKAVDPIFGSSLFFWRFRPARRGGSVVDARWTGRVGAERAGSTARNREKRCPFALLLLEDGELEVVVGEAELIFAETLRRVEVADGGSLGEGLDGNDDLSTEALAFRGDGVVGDDGELAESDDDCSSTERSDKSEKGQEKRTNRVPETWWFAAVEDPMLEGELSRRE